MNDRSRWLVVILFAGAMAWVEAAVVLYLRVYLNRLQPYQLDPLPVSIGLGKAELIREAATMLMLFCVGWLAGSDRRSRLGYALLAFGVWDILYYVFLVPLSGWPNSLLDWDILFLIPLPWWGPVLAPASIAGLLALGGTLVTQFPRDGRLPWPHWPAFLPALAGACLALYAFMADALQALPRGSGAVRNVLPASFNWPLFALAMALMAIPVVDLLWQRWNPLSGWRERRRTPESMA
jgi:hypothetical protein